VTTISAGDLRVIITTLTPGKWSNTIRRSRYSRKWMTTRMRRRTQIYVSGDIKASKSCWKCPKKAIFTEGLFS